MAGSVNRESGPQPTGIAYGPRDAASALMDSGHVVSLRTPRQGEPAEMIRMADGTRKRMTWVVDGAPRSRTQIEDVAPRAESRARADRLAAMNGGRPRVA